MAAVFFLCGVAPMVVSAQKTGDRPFWIAELDRIARPVMRSLAHDSLRINMPTAVSIHIDNAEARRKVAYLEILGRTLSGIAPWLWEHLDTVSRQRLVDGPGYAFDYYNSYVIHPYLATICDIIGTKTNAYHRLVWFATEPRVFPRRMIFGPGRRRNGVHRRSGAVRISRTTIVCIDMNIILKRMINQGVVGRRFPDPVALVGWMGCVQAQDFAMAKWGVGLRVGAPGGSSRGTGAARGAEISGAAIDAAFNAGAILRTHVLRPTWHFVLPADIGWLLRLSAPRIRGFCAPYHRQLGIDAAVLRKSRKIMSAALLDGAFLTRVEIAALLKRAKLDTSDIRMNFLMMDAELEGLICSGPRRGKQFTYALLASRVPRPVDLSGDAALGELARRYFLSRGPATVNDLAWWGGMTLGQAKRGLDVVKGELSSAVVEGVDYWFRGDSEPKMPAALLLPAYDELTVAYKDRSAILPTEFEKVSFSGLKPTIVVNGRIVGIWRRVAVKGKVVVELTLLEKVSKTAMGAIEKEARRYGRFLGEGVGLLHGQGLFIPTHRRG
ncbi:MAG TPA: crosslink repair DNA glycosylase YcaQ family protein [Puia sp.]|nr:crosslink repair DNA glycosylase YcaQ family protein [Puia sp.]